MKNYVKKSPKILLVATMSYAGMGPYVVSIINSFDSNDNVRFFLVEGNDEYYSRNIKKELIPLCKIVKVMESKLSTLVNLTVDPSPKFTSIFKHFCLFEKISIVHVITPLAYVKLAEWIKKHHIYIQTIHDLEPHESKKIFYKQWRQNVLYKREYKCVGICDNLHTNDSSQFNKLQIKFPDKRHFYSSFPTLITDTIENGNIVPNELKNIDSYILFFGRIEAYKGIEYLISAFEKYKYQFPGQRKLVIAGKGNISLVNDEDIIHINRYISDQEIAQLYRRAACVVYPYISATQSGVLSVASFFHTRIVASDITFFKELLEGVAGTLLFPSRNVDELGKCIVEILKSPNDNSFSLDNFYNENYGTDNLKMELYNIYDSFNRSCLN